MADDRKDPPIQEQNFLYGIRVVDIGDYRVSRGLSRRASSSCPHHRMVYDKSERRIWCKDCETDVEPFDAFRFLAEHFSSQTDKLNRREQEIKAAENYRIISLAGKALDKAWRSKKMVPMCPSCKAGLFPEDFKNGCALLGRDYAMAQRKKMNNDK